MTFDAREEKIDHGKVGKIRDALEQELGKEGIKLFDDLKEDEEDSWSCRDIEQFEERVYNEIKEDYGVERAENIVEKVKRIRLSSQLDRLEKESKNVDERRKRFDVLKTLGDICLNLNELDRAKNYYEEMYSLGKTLKRSGAVVSSLKSLAELYLFEGEIEKVKKKANDIIKKAKELGDDAGRAEGVRLAGIAAWRKENTQEALNYLERALELFKEEDLAEKVATVQRDLGDIYIAEEDHTKSIELYRKAADNFGEVGMIYEKIHLLQEIGMILSEIDQIEEAIESFEEAQKEANEHSFVNQEAWCIFNSGELYLEYNDLPEGRKKLEKAMNMFEEQKDLYGEAGTRLTYGKVLAKNEETKRSERNLKRAADLFDRLDLLDSKTEALYQLSSVQETLGYDERARRNLEEALKLSDSLDMEEIKDKIVEKLGELTK